MVIYLLGQVSNILTDNHLYSASFGMLQLSCAKFYGICLYKLFEPFLNLEQAGKILLPNFGTPCIRFEQQTYLKLRVL